MSKAEARDAWWAASWRAWEARRTFGEDSAEYEIALRMLDQWRRLARRSR